MRATAHCPKNNMNLCIQIMVGAERNMYVRFMNQILVNKSQIYCTRILNCFIWTRRDSLGCYADIHIWDSALLELVQLRWDLVLHSSANERPCFTQFSQWETLFYTVQPMRDLFYTVQPMRDLVFIRSSNESIRLNSLANERPCFTFQLMRDLVLHFSQWESWL